MLHHLRLCELPLLLRWLLLLRSLGRLHLPRHLLLGYRNRLLLQRRPGCRLILGQLTHLSRYRRRLLHGVLWLGLV